MVNGEEVEDVEELSYQRATVENVKQKWLNKNNESKLKHTRTNESIKY